MGSADFGWQGLHIDHLDHSIAPSVYIFQPTGRRARFARQFCVIPYWPAFLIALDDFRLRNFALDPISYFPDCVRVAAIGQGKVAVSFR